MAEYLAENSQLRQLSRRYAEGKLAFADYREARREILRALNAGTVQAYTEEPIVASRIEPDVDSTNVRLPDDSPVFYKTMPPRAQTAVLAEEASDTDSAAPATHEAWDGSTRTLAMVLGVLLLIAVGALIYVFVL
jgi:hypothetical protein